MTIKEKIVEKWDKIDEKFKVRHFKFHYIASGAILLALPLTVILAQNQTNTSTRAQSTSTNVLSDDSMIIPALNAEEDAETYIPPTNMAAAQKDLTLDTALDDQILNTRKAITASTPKPNIVFLLLDDTAYMDDRIWDRLPTIKELFINQGARFTNFQGETPLCCPGRAGFLTGQHTTNHKANSNDASLFDPSMTIATQLQKAGYFTFLSGKYLNGFNANKMKTPGWDRFSGYGGGYEKFWLWNNGKHVYYPTQYSTNIITKKALTYLRQVPANKPVFAYIAPYAVHFAPTRPSGLNTFPHPKPDAKYIGDPRCANIPKWNPPNYNEADMSDKPNYNKTHALMTDPDGWDLTYECESLLSVEDLARKVKAELISQGRLKNTVFILGADNGMMWGAHRYYGKVWPYATQVNFFVNWPNGIGTAPFTISDAVTNVDLAPTLCEIGGCQMGPYPNGQTKPDGKSFLSLLKRQTATMGRDAVLTDFTKGGYSPGENVPIYYSLMTTPTNPLGLWHYVEYATGEKELYDLSHGPCISWTPSMGGDPCELNNLLAPNITPSDYNLKIVSVDKENNLLAVRGAVPGPAKGVIVIRG